MKKLALIKTVAIVAVLVAISGPTAEEAKAWPWPWVNPQIADSGKQLTGAYYDPFAGRVVIRSDRQRVRESFLDPNRGFADPGSKHWVNRHETDAQGRIWHVTGWQWTSNGVPHGNLKRSRISATGIPGIDHQENDRVAFSYRPGGNGNNGQAGVAVGSNSNQRHNQQRILNHQQRMNRNRINHLFD